LTGAKAATAADGSVMVTEAGKLSGLGGALSLLGDGLPMLQLAIYMGK